MQLKITTPYTEGSAVVRLQEFGDLLGYDYGPNDGVYGPATERAVKDIQKDFGLNVTGVCDDITWSTIVRHIDSEYSYDGNGIVLNVNHTKPKLYNKQRTLQDITGVTLHQTGCKMPKDPSKWCNLNAHIGITEEGVVVLCNLFTDYIWHAQGLSAHTIGIEIAGNFAGIEGKSFTVWAGGGAAASLSDKQIAGADRALAHIQSRLLSFTGIYAHRQSCNSRQGDPGSAIWQKIAIPWINKLGLDRIALANYVSGEGRQIPTEWDSGSTKKY